MTADATTIAVVVSAGSSIMFGAGGYITGLATRRRAVLDTVITDREKQAGREAAETVAARISAELDRQFKSINDHLILQDRRIQRQGERLARIEGKLGLPAGDDD